MKNIKSIIDEEYLDVKGLTERWGCTVSALAVLRANGSGPEYYKLVGRVRYPLSKVIEYENRVFRLQKNTAQNHKTAAR